MESDTTAATPATPRVVVWYDQGIVQCVIADQAVEVIVVDIDTDGDDPLTEIPHPDNYDSSLSVYVNRHRQVDVLPEWVDVVFNSEPESEDES